MVEVEEFRAENREIRDLCHILGLSVDKYSLRHNSVVCELLERFADRVCEHLAHEDRSVYRDLLKMHTHEADMLADKFLGNTQELKKIFNDYKRGWCRKPHSENMHAKYVDESMEMFKLVCDRIDFEENKIFPHFEE